MKNPAGIPNHPVSNRKGAAAIRKRLRRFGMLMVITLPEKLSEKAEKK